VFSNQLEWLKRKTKLIVFQQITVFTPNKNNSIQKIFGKSDKLVMIFDVEPVNSQLVDGEKEKTCLMVKQGRISEK
jgi:hypothetical protein